VPNYCGEFDNAGGVMLVDESLMCSFKILKPSTKINKYISSLTRPVRPVTPPPPPTLNSSAKMTNSFFKN